MSEPQFTGTTHIGVVLDKSGSMGGVRRETIGGFNRWLETMQKETGDIRFSLTLFDTSYSTPIKEAPIGKVNPLDETRYQPSGSTALLDAVADSVKALETGEAVNGNDRYLICIMTDGEENSSKRTTKEDLAELIRQKEASGRWTFTYLSAGMDAFADAQAIGIQAGNSVAYTGDSVGTQKAFAGVATRMAAYTASARLSCDSFFGGSRSMDDVDLDAVVGQPPVVTAKPRSASRSTPLGSTAWTTDASIPVSTAASSWTS